jgi:hypothetical protein
VIQSETVKRFLLLLGFALATTPALGAENAIGKLFSTDANIRGAVSLSEHATSVLSGSQITAGDGIATLKLGRGGDVRICPKTNLSMSMDPSGKSLVLGLNVGSVELNYAMRNSADTLITPDFRVQLISPGVFHLEISVAASGDTCMRTLAGDDAAVFIAEMMGTDSYQLSPGKNVMFRAGKIAGATEAPAECGCPEPEPEPIPPAPAVEVATEVEPAPVTSNPAVQHLEVNGAFVYRGNEEAQDYYTSVAKLSVSSDDSKLALALLPKVSQPEPPSQPAPAPQKAGMMRRFRKFLGHIFSGK